MHEKENRVIPREMRMIHLASIGSEEDAKLHRGEAKVSPSKHKQTNNLFFLFLFLKSKRILIFWHLPQGDHFARLPSRVSGQVSPSCERLLLKQKFMPLTFLWPVYRVLFMHKCLFDCLFFHSAHLSPAATAPFLSGRLLLQHGEGSCPRGLLIKKNK